jgi:hypothetical protein
VARSRPSTTSPAPFSMRAVTRSFLYAWGLAAGVALLVTWACADQGWCFLTPPVFRKADRTFMPSSSAPLTNWEHQGSFDSAEQCEVAQAELARKAGPRCGATMALSWREPWPALTSPHGASRLTTHA